MAGERKRKWWAAIGAAVLATGGGFATPAAADDAKPAAEKATDAKPPAFKPEDVRVGPPPELAALRKAVEDAGKKGENVDEVRKQLEALEKALAGKAWAKPKPQPDPVPPATPRGEVPLFGRPVPFPVPAAPFPADGGGDEALARLRLMMELQNRALEAQLGQLNGNGVIPPRIVLGPNGLVAGRNDGRLGVSLEAVSPALAAQLELKDGGVVVAAVRPNSAADKAGLVPHDVIVAFNGKPVADARELVRLVDGVNAGEKVDVDVVRKGKKDVVKGVVLPDRAAAEVPAARPRVIARRGAGTSTQVVVSGDKFTIKAAADGVRYTVEGSTADGTAVPSAITVEDGDKKVEAAAVDKLPAEYKEKVEKLLAGVRVGGVRRDRVQD